MCYIESNKVNFAVLISKLPHIELVNDPYHIHYNKCRERNIPCWSVGALLDLMPMVNGREPHLIWTKGTYTCFYYSGNRTTKETMVEAAYNMMVWFLENNYIKKEE